MKKFALLLFFIIAVITVSLAHNVNDTVTLNSEITDVTLFFHGAQITRKAKINLPKGKYLLVLDKLPAGITPQSIQVDNNGKGEILSVRYDTTTSDNQRKLISEFEEKIRRKKIRLKEIRNKKEVLDMEEKFLLDTSN